MPDVGNTLTMGYMKALSWAAVLAAIVFLAGCGPAAPEAGEPPPVTVRTVQVQPQDWPVRLRAVGSVTPPASVEVRPQVTATVQAVHVKDGDIVRAGQLLFTLDGRPGAAQAAQAQAQIVRDRATLADLQRQQRRAEELLAQRFVSQGAVDTARAQVQAQAAVVAAGEAAWQGAQLNLGYARITAPMAGRAGIVAVSPGAVVQAGQTPLVTLVQIDPIDVAFGVPQRLLADVLAAQRAGDVSVTAEVPGSAPLTGRLHVVDNAVGAGSGTVTVKARFANADQLLWPGAFAQISLTLRTLPGALVVPQAAIVQGQRERALFVVQGGKAQRKTITVLDSADGNAVVSGLAPGAQVVVEGRTNVRDGAPVVLQQP